MICFGFWALPKLSQSQEDTYISDGTVEVLDSRSSFSDSLSYFVSDSNFDAFYYYQPYLNRMASVTGNYGGSIMSLVPSKIEGDQSIRMQWSVWEIYIKDSRDLRHYRTPVPYTSISYYNGPLQEQEIGFVHGQNVTPNWNVGLSYNKATTEGYYTNKKNTISNFGFSSSYVTKDQSYRLFTGFVVSSVTAEENGGIVND